MKKYFLSIVALAGMLFATSCQESLVEPQVGGPTTFTIEIPGQMGTKATGDQYALFVEVYSADGVTKIHRLEDAITVGTPKTVSLNLVATQVYDIIFWAQKEGASYDVENLNKVEITNEHHNSEDGAAFYAIKNDYKPVEVNNPSVTLKRPFAQLNIGTIDEVSYDNNGNKKLEILSTKIKVESAAKYFERINTQESPELGEGRTEVVFEYTGGDVLNSTMTVNTKTYKQVSMDYISVLGNKAVVVVTATIKVKDPNGVESTIERVITNVPLQMNYKTNIVGNLITSASDFTIEISEDWDGTDIDKEVVFREVATEAELIEAIEEEVENITLTADITLTGTLTFGEIPVTNPIARASATEVPSFVLDLGGKTITTGLENVDDPSRHKYAIHNYANLTIIGQGAINARGIKNFGTMTIDGDITIKNVDTNGGAAIWNEGDITINGGTFISGNPGTIVENSYGAALNTRPTGGNVIVNGGTFIAYSKLTYAIINEGKNTIINNAIVKGRHGAVAGAESNDNTKIYGGSFEQTGVQGQSDHCTYFVSAIYGGSYAIEQPTDAGGQVFYESNIANGYKAVLAADGKTYVVLPDTPEVEEYDLVITDPAQLNNTVLGNKTNILLQLAAREYEIDLYTNISDSDSRNLTIIGTEGTKVKFKSLQVRLALFKNFTIKNCEILHMATKSWGMLVFSSGNKADGVYTIENCTFNGVKTQGIYINETVGGTYNIKNCTFNGDFGTEGAITISTHQGVNHTVNVKGCEFNNVPADHRIFLTPSTAGLFYDFTLNTDLKAVTNNEVAIFIALCNEDIKLSAGTYTIDLYNIKYRENLTITGTVGTKVEFANLQVVTYRFKNLMIQDCEILRMPNKNWGMLVFGGASPIDGVYTIKNCTFNGVGTSGIYINEENSGIRYDIINCTFNGDFGNDLAVAIQNNQGVNHSVNVTNCTFNNIQGQVNDVKVFYNNPGLSLNIVGDGQVLWNQGELLN